MSIFWCIGVSSYQIAADKSRSEISTRSIHNLFFAAYRMCDLDLTNLTNLAGLSVIRKAGAAYLAIDITNVLYVNSLFFYLPREVPALALRIMFILLTSVAMYAHGL